MTGRNALAAGLVGVLCAAALVRPALTETASGWHVLPLEGRPVLFSNPVADDGVRLHGANAAALATQQLAGWVTADTCLSWRWRVDALPPEASPDEAGRTPAPFALWVGFRPDAERMTLAQRYAFGLVRFRSPVSDPPGFVLAYAQGRVAGGQGWQGLPQHFLGPMARQRMLPPEALPHATWVEQTVRLAAEFRSAFAVPATQVMQVALHADAGSGAAVVDVSVASVRLHRCAPLLP